MLYDTRDKLFIADMPVSNVFGLNAKQEEPVPSDFNSALSMINLRSDLSRMLQTELHDPGVPDPQSQHPRQGFLTKLLWAIAVFYLGFDYVMCYLMYWIVYIPQL